MSRRSISTLLRSGWGRLTIFPAASTESGKEFFTARAAGDPGAAANRVFFCTKSTRLPSRCHWKMNWSIMMVP